VDYLVLESRKPKTGLSRKVTPKQTGIFYLTSKKIAAIKGG
jgi:hypothetical protein